MVTEPHRGGTVEIVLHADGTSTQTFVPASPPCACRWCVRPLPDDEREAIEQAVRALRARKP